MKPTKAFVPLDDVVSGIAYARMREAFLDPDTGRIILVFEEDRVRIETGDFEGLSEIERKLLVAKQRVLASGRALRLPELSETHYWDLMHRFSTSVEDVAACAALLDAVHGSRPSDAFRMTVDRLELWSRWVDYREEAYRRLARNWLDHQGIGYLE